MTKLRSGEGDGPEKNVQSHQNLDQRQCTTVGSEPRLQVKGGKVHSVVTRIGRKYYVRFGKFWKGYRERSRENFRKSGKEVETLTAPGKKERGAKG